MRTLFTGFTWLSISVLFVACGGGPYRDGLEWNGRPLPVEEIHSLGSPAAVLDNLESPPVRILRVLEEEPGESLVLFEFSGQESAYLAFQGLASTVEDFRAGYTVAHDRVFFLRGRWLGAIEIAKWRGIEEFNAGLMLPQDHGEDGTLPAVFSSLLHQDRIPGTERILAAEFLGLPIDYPVYAVQMDCQGDLAWLYAGYRVPVDFVRRALDVTGGEVDSASSRRYIEVRATTPAPLTMRILGRKVVAVEGCFDEVLAEYWLKMQTRALKQLK